MYNSMLKYLILTEILSDTKLGQKSTVISSYLTDPRTIVKFADPNFFYFAYNHM